MTPVDLQRQSDGRLHFSLGPVEKWGAAFAGLVITAMAWWMASSVQTLLTQQAVTNQQLATIVNGQADMPMLRKDVTELKVRMDQHSQDIRELKALRGVK